MDPVRRREGIGRDGGDYLLDFSTETEHVSLARGARRIQRLTIVVIPRRREARARNLEIPGSMLRIAPECR